MRSSLNTTYNEEEENDSDGDEDDFEN